MKQEQDPQGKTPPQGNGDSVVIHIDKQQHRLSKTTATGAELRSLGGIGTGYDLWKKVPGRDDLRISDTQTVELKNGDHFYSAPSTLNPGGKYRHGSR